MLQGYTIICFAPNDWWGMNPSCTTHIMRRLAKDNKVLFINPFSSDLGGGIRKGFAGRLKRKLKSLLKYFRQAEKNLYVFSPIFIPFQGNRVIDAMNNVWLKMQIRLIQKKLGGSKTLLWIENIRASDMIDWFSPEAIIYHVSDLFTQCKYTANKQMLENREKLVSERSDLAICVSKSLYQLKSSQHPNVHYMPHGVDFQKYREAADQSQTLEELRDIARPIVGYFGTMTANNDIELLLYCAKQLPEMSFVFAGQITGGDYSELLALPNVYHLGRMDYDKIPVLCAGFDVCMLQWKVTDWIRNCNPLKLQEYMASGRPIVSVPIREVEEKYSSLVSVADCKEDFCKAIVWELEHDTSERADARIEIARQHGWDQHVEQISELVSDVLRQKSEQ